MQTKPIRIPTLRFMLLWQIAALALMLVLLAAVLHLWPWQLDQRELTPYAGMLAAFGATAVWHLIILRREPTPRMWLALGGAIAFFYFLTLMLFLTRADSSRAFLLAAFAVAVVVLPAPLIGPRMRKLGVVALPLALIAVSINATQERHDPQLSSQVQQR